MLVEGFKFAIGLGMGCILFLVASVIAAAVIFRVERLAYQRGWLEEPNRAMPRVKGHLSVLPFAARPTPQPPLRDKAE